MISFLESPIQYEDINVNFNDLNEVRNENTNIEENEFNLENIADLGADLNDLMNDNDENTFGISLYEDLIDINSIEVVKNNSNIQKTVESEVTLKSKIETSLVIYKVNFERTNTTVICEEKNVNFGFSNDLIGTGTLILEKIEDPDVFTLTWEGKLLEFFVNNQQKDQETSKYSFLLRYIIDINLKVIQDEEFFVFIKSDFQLENETIFLQFSFNTEEKANFWYENLSKYKQLTIKKSNIKENDHYNVQQNQLKISKEYPADYLMNDQKHTILLSSNSQAPKISIPFFRDNKRSKKNSNISNSLSYHHSENLFPLIKHEDKVFIENQIKNLIYSTVNNDHQHFNFNNISSFDIESNKSVIQQKCSFIKFVVNSIQTNNMENKFLSLSNSTLSKPFKSSSSCENTHCSQISKENNVNNLQSQLFTCPICYESYDYNDIITLQPCGHQLCFNCEYKLVDSKCPWDRYKYTIKH
ncbi:RING domain-containing protein [Cryptosporidium ubiquitum]|uniref:RING domain-containing protein n=1 Tax=Cryptosporidium ubiquitum TaxID=857276 RepID=A0A1J4MCP0_9CRYT|nr:RING domain-containing protein [Cryptosporidium ubiquitum]OII72001.1 RING domain-containing protein [Cryptosporidium ubiquitum]